MIGMLRRLIFLPILLASLSVLHAEAVSSSTSTLIAAGDALYPERASVVQNKAALAFYEQSIAANPDLTEAYWKASRALWWAGTQEKDRASRMDFFKKGIEWGEKAIQKAPDSAEAHFWLAGNYASYGETKGVMSSLSMIGKIRKELDRVNQLNDRYLAGGAYRIQGIMDYKVPAIAGGNKKRALERLEKSLAMDTQNPLTVFYMADYYAAIGDKEKAKAYLAQLDTLKPTPDFAAELPLMQKKAERLRKKL